MRTRRVKIELSFDVPKEIPLQEIAPAIRNCIKKFPCLVKNQNPIVVKNMKTTPAKEVKVIPESHHPVSFGDIKWNIKTSSK